MSWWCKLANVRSFWIHGSHFTFATQVIKTRLSCYTQYNSTTVPPETYPPKSNWNSCGFTRTIHRGFLTNQSVLSIPVTLSVTFCLPVYCREYYMASSYVEQPMGRCVGRSLAHALRIHALHCTTLVHNQPVKELSTFNFIQPSCNRVQFDVKSVASQNPCLSTNRSFSFITNGNKNHSIFNWTVK